MPGQISVRTIGHSNQTFCLFQRPVRFGVVEKHMDTMSSKKKVQIGMKQWFLRWCPFKLQGFCEFLKHNGSSNV